MRFDLQAVFSFLSRRFSIRPAISEGCCREARRNPSVPSIASRGETQYTHFWVVRRTLTGENPPRAAGTRLRSEANIGVTTKNTESYRRLRLLGISFAVGGLVLAISWTLRIGLADLAFNRNTLQGTQTAIRLTPGQSEYQDDLASYFREDDPQRAIQSWQQAVHLNPYDAAAWIDLGLIYEREDRLADADRCFHRAADVDHTFLPSWTLANFYFRQNNPAQFWLWVRQASRIVPEDASPLFRLCWHFTEDGNEIARQLDLNRPEIMAQYLNFLMSDHRKDAVGRISLRLAASHREKDTPLLLNTVNWLLAEQQESQALLLWNKLATQARVPYPALDPRSHPAVVNAGFARSPTSIGFDWHLPNMPGIMASQESGVGGLRLEFSGDQPESVEILSQVLAVEPSTPYTFAFDYSTSGIAPASGLTWTVASLADGSVLAMSDSLSSDSETVGHLSFMVPANSRFVRLSLVYHRALGTTRIEGSLILRKTGLALAASGTTKNETEP